MAAADRSRDWQRRFLDALSEGLDDIAEGVEFVATDIVAAEAIDEGSLLKSFKVRKPEKLKREIAATARHAVFVEFGTRPHWPPLKPILEWVKRNLIRTESGLEFKAKRGRRLRATRDQRIEAKVGPVVVKVHPEHLRVARAVQAKIARDGTPPVAYMRRAAAMVARKASTIIRQAVERHGAA